MKKPVPIELSLKDQEALLERIRTSMSEKDAEILKGLIDFNAWLQYSLEQKNISIHKLQKIFGSSTEKRNKKDKNDRSDTEKDKNSEESNSGNDDVDSELAESESTDDGSPVNQSAFPETKPKKYVPNNGRLGHEKYTNASVIHRECLYHLSDPCPEEGCQGKLKGAKLGCVIKIVGQSFAKANKYVFETVRCNLCDKGFSAQLPEDVCAEKYDPVFKAELCVHKYFLGIPNNRLESYQRLVGVPLPDSTQFDKIEVVPGPEKNLSMTESVSKAVVRSAAAVVLNDGTANDLAVNLASASMGAAIGKAMSDLGSEHGAALASRQGFNTRIAPASNVTSAATSSSASHTDGNPPVKPSSSSTRVYGLSDSTFDRELNVAHQSAQDLFFDVELERSFNYTTKGFARTWTKDSVETKYRFDEPPVLLWSAPNRLNRSSEYTFGREATSVLDIVARAAELSALSSAMEENGTTLMPIQSGFGAMALRALFGDQSPEIIAWQQQTRSKAPGLAREFDALQEVKPLQIAKSAGRGIKDSVVETVEFLAEEAARLRLGEKTKTGRIVNVIGTFLGEEAARVTLHEETQTERFKRAVDSFVHEEVVRFRLGEETKTQALIFKGFQKLCEMPAEELTYHLGKGAGDMLVGYGIGRGLKLTCKAAEWGIGGGFSELREFLGARTFRSPLVLEYDPNRLHSGVPLDLFKLRKPWVSKDVLSEIGRLHPSPLFKHEEAIIAQWAAERLRLLEKWKGQDLSGANPKMRRLLNKCRAQLREHMTPDDLAAIMKEQRGIKIFKEEGGIFDHINSEWRDVRSSFENAFNGPRFKSIQEEQIVNERFGDISRMWTRYKEMIERAKCNSETQKLKLKS